MKNIQLIVRANTGVDTKTKVADMAIAKATAKDARVTANHMVCIDVDGYRHSRWDRDRVTGTNHWRKVDVNEMEVLGPIREISRA
jgi:hypothetical protein